VTSTTSRPASAWRPLLPVPEGVAPARFGHSVRGDPLRIFTYRDVEGRLLGYVCRFRRSDGGYLALARTWCVNEADGSCAWKWIQFRSLRPMFGAERLDAERTNIVVVCSSEAAADAISQRAALAPDGKPRLDHPFLGYDAVSWPGGLKKLGEVDWSALKGRICAIWLPHSAARFKVLPTDPQAGGVIPRERQPGRVAAQKLRETLTSFGAIVVSVIEAPTTDDFPDGWDAEQALNEGWSLERVATWFQAHFATPQAVAEAKAVASSAPLPGAEWMRTLIRKDGTGPLLAELHNVRLMLSHHEAWRGVIYLDEFAHSIQKGAKPPFEGGALGEWADTDDTMASDWLSAYAGIHKLRTSLVAEAVQAVAKLHGRNPLVEFLRSLRWDGKPRLASWLRRFVNAGPFDENMTAAEIEHLDGYLAVVGRLWLMGAVKRALQPGCKFDYVLILEGMQGLGKSNVFQVIGGQWTMDSPVALGDKEGMETIRGKWIIEIPELDALNKVESSIAKSFFSRRMDRFRLPYAKRSLDFKRSCAFGGTTNESEYLRDPTGDRRYWPVHCGRAGYDWTRLEKVRDQLLAEAVHLVEQGGQIWPTREEEKLIAREQRKRQLLDPWIATISGWLRDPDPESIGRSITGELIMRKALHIDIARMDERGMRSRVGRAMHRLGYVKVEDKTLAERFRYEKPPASEGEADER
jgi:predicted P-loop ATPase